MVFEDLTHVHLLSEHQLPVGVRVLAELREEAGRRRVGHLGGIDRGALNGEQQVVVRPVLQGAEEVRCVLARRSAQPLVHAGGELDAVLLRDALDQLRHDAGLVLGVGRGMWQRCVPVVAGGRGGQGVPQGDTGTGRAVVRTALGGRAVRRPVALPGQILEGVVVVEERGGRLRVVSQCLQVAGERVLALVVRGTEIEIVRRIDPVVAPFPCADLLLAVVDADRWNEGLLVRLEQGFAVVVQEPGVPLPGAHQVAHHLEPVGRRRKGSAHAHVGCLPTHALVAEVDDVLLPLPHGRRVRVAGQGQGAAEIVLKGGKLLVHPFRTVHRVRRQGVLVIRLSGLVPELKHPLCAFACGELLREVGVAGVHREDTVGLGYQLRVPLEILVARQLVQGIDILLRLHLRAVAVEAVAARVVGQCLLQVRVGLGRVAEGLLDLLIEVRTALFGLLDVFPVRVVGQVDMHTAVLGVQPQKAVPATLGLLGDRGLDFRQVLLRALEHLQAAGHLLPEPLGLAGGLRDLILDDREVLDRRLLGVAVPAAPLGAHRFGHRAVERRVDFPEVLREFFPRLHHRLQRGQIDVAHRPVVESVAHESAPPRTSARSRALSAAGGRTPASATAAASAADTGPWRTGTAVSGRAAASGSGPGGT